MDSVFNYWSHLSQANQGPELVILRLPLVDTSIERNFAIIHPLRLRGRLTRRQLKMYISSARFPAKLVNIPIYEMTS